MNAEKPIYQFKITLYGIRPPIWRRFQVHSGISFVKFHYIIQAVMGWWNCHLYNFNVGDHSFTDRESALEFDYKDASRHKINRYITAEGQKLRYEYDFGDGWLHEIVLEKILPPDPEASYPVCIKGKRNCPPEDCGGPWGYQALLEALKDPNHPQLEMYADWLEEDYDPEEFLLEFANAELEEFRLS